MQNMQRYLVFHYADYYPHGGFQDYIGKCDTPAEIEILCNNSNFDPQGTIEIVDLHSFCSVQFDADDVGAMDFNRLDWMSIVPKISYTI